MGNIASLGWDLFHRLFFSAFRFMFLDFCSLLLWISGRNEVQLHYSFILFEYVTVLRI